MINKSNINKLYYKRCFAIVYLIFLTSYHNNSEAQDINLQNDTISSEDTINKGLIIQDDIFYDALDSMYIDINNRRILLYGDAIIKYENTEITASFIKIDWIENEIYWVKHENYWAENESEIVE